MKYSINKRAKGFTLIELMIVVSIIGILAAVALPLYNDYATRARMSEVLLAVSACRQDLTEYVQNFKSKPTEDQFTCTFSETSLVAGLIWDGDRIVATTSNATELADARNLEVFLTPTLLNDSTNIQSWSCGGTVPTRYMPMNCR